MILDCQFKLCMRPPRQLTMTMQCESLGRGSIGFVAFHILRWESTEILTPLQSSTSTLSTSLAIRVRTKPGVDDVIDLYGSSNKDVLVQKTIVHDYTLLFPFASYVIHSPSHSMPVIPLVTSTSKPPQTIVQCLHHLGFVPDNKNVLTINSKSKRLITFPIFRWYQIICPPCNRNLIISNQGQVIGRYGQAI